MSTTSTTQHDSAPARPWYRAAALFTFLAVAMGSAVCATESGAACPTWPGCFTGKVTPSGLNSVIEFSHRVVAFTSLVLMAVAGIKGRRLRSPLLRTLPWVALVAAIASGVFGMMIVLFHLAKPLGLIDLFAALAAMSMMAAAAVGIDRDPVPFGRTRLGDIAWAGVGTVIVLHLLGAYVSATGSFTRCVGWPVWRMVAADGHPGSQVVRLVIGAAAAALGTGAGGLAVRAANLRTHGLVLLVLLAAELVLGQLIVEQFLGGAPRQIGVAALYSMLAGAILWCLALLAARASRPALTSAAGPVDQRVTSAP